MKNLKITNRLKHNLISLLVYSVMIYILLLPFKIYLTGISISILIGFLFGLFKSSLKLLKYKKKGEKKMKILRVLGFKDFLRFNEVTSELKELYPQDNFDNCSHILFAKNPQMRLWMIDTDKMVYFTLDNGTDLDIVYKQAKKDLEFSVDEGEKVARLTFPNTDYKLPIDKGLTGGIETIINTLNKFKNEKTSKGLMENYGN